MKTLEDMRAALQSQDEALSNAKQQLAAMGDVQIAVPTSHIEDLEQLTTTRTAQPTNSAIRA